MAVPLPSHEEKLGKTIPILSLDFLKVKSIIVAFSNCKLLKPKKISEL